MSATVFLTAASGLKSPFFHYTLCKFSMISRTMGELQAITLCGDRFKNISTSGLTHLSRIPDLVEIALVLVAWKSLTNTWVQVFRLDFNPLVSDELISHLVDGAQHLRCVSLANSGTDQSISMNGLRKLSDLKELEQVTK